MEMVLNLLHKNLILGRLNNFNDNNSVFFFKVFLDFYLSLKVFNFCLVNEFLIFSIVKNSWFSDIFLTVNQSNFTLFRNRLIKMFQGPIFRYFTRVSFVGLGMRVFPTKHGNFLRLDIGLSHFIILNLGKNIRARWKRKQLTLIGPNRGSLKNIINTLMRIKKPSPYKKRGLVSSLWSYRKKVGKKR